MGVDPASSTRKTADYSTVVAIAVDDKSTISCFLTLIMELNPMILISISLQNSSANFLNTSSPRPGVNNLSLVSIDFNHNSSSSIFDLTQTQVLNNNCLLYTSDAADE